MRGEACAHSRTALRAFRPLFIRLFAFASLSLFPPRLTRNRGRTPRTKAADPVPGRGADESVWLAACGTP